MRTDERTTHRSMNRLMSRGVWTRLPEVLGTEHALGPAQDGVLRGVVRVLLGRDLQHRRDGLHVAVDGVADHLSDELVDEDDADVITGQEAPVEAEGGGPLI